MAVCRHCHQTIRVERFGVAMPPLKAAIIDLIVASGDLGVTSAEIIASELYRDRRRVKRDAIKSHIWQINEMLEETAWRIRGEGDYETAERRWYLRRRKVRRVA